MGRQLEVAAGSGGWRWQLQVAAAGAGGVLEPMSPMVHSCPLLLPPRCPPRPHPWHCPLAVLPPAWPSWVRGMGVEQGWRQPLAAVLREEALPERDQDLLVTRTCVRTP